jgi:hypothetical protein
MRRMLGMMAAVVAAMGPLAAWGAEAAATERAAADPAKQVQQARQLAQEGKIREAVEIYLVIPGCEGAAMELMRRRGEEFLPVVEGWLTDEKSGLSEPRTLLVKGDLLLGKGDKTGALECYRGYAGKIARAGEGWEKRMVPADYYPVEISEQSGESREMMMPFTRGPGSHRDNWLLRRFIGLEAWEDAAKEFGRIEGLYRKATGEKAWSGLAMELALDEAYFWQRQGKVERGMDLLREVLVQMDMDELPTEGVPGRSENARGGMWGSGAGVSRKEFIRLAYGYFKTAGKEGDLLAALQKEIDGGRNSCRRVLARVQYHQELPEAALASELAYIEAGKFDTLSAAWRKGMAYEEAAKMTEAAGQYEKALGMAFSKVNVPTEDEDDRARQMMSQIVIVRPAIADSAQALHDAVMERLIRVYTGLGQTETILDLSLRQLEENPKALRNRQQLEQVAARFKTAGAEARFKTWLKGKTGANVEPAVRVNALWMLGEQEEAIGAVVEMVQKATPENRGLYDAREWVNVLLPKDVVGARRVLAALVKANPKDGETRLRLLEATPEMGDAEMIGHLEALLAPDAENAFGWGKGNTVRTQIQDYFDAAYRLMRRYEKTGQVAKLEALALRMARREKPFTNYPSDQYEYRERNGVPEFANDALSLAVALADKQALPALAEALATSPFAGPAAQAQRRLAESWPAAAADFGWTGVPAGVRVVASGENVLSLCRDERRLFAGQPWGVSVYDLTGKPITRVALGTGARDLAVAGGALWAATGEGVYRIGLEKYDVSFLPCDQELDDQTRADGRLDKARQINAIDVLAVRGNELWIGGVRNVRVLNTKTMEVQVFSARALGVEQYFRTSKILFDDKYVWIDGTEGVRRYDPKTETWAEVPMVGRDKTYPVHLIEQEDGTLWGHAWLNEELRDRPCIVDRETMQVKPILIDNPKNGTACINGPFSIFGRYHGNLVFGAGGPSYVYDSTAQKMRPFAEDWDHKADPIETDAPPGLWSGTQWTSGGRILCLDDQTHSHILQDAPFMASGWTLLKLENGTLVIGGRSAARNGEFTEDSGGLFVLPPGGRPRKVSAEAKGDTLIGDQVRFMVADPTDASWRWAGTSVGLALLDGQGRVVARVGRNTGMVANSLVAGAALGGKLYLGGQWGDSGGGLGVYDPATWAFTALTVSDGLATDHIAGLTANRDTLQITYGAEYQRSGRGDYSLYDPSTFMPASGRFSAVGEARRVEQPRYATISDAPDVPEDGAEGCPALGGRILMRANVGERTYIGGTRGLVILEGIAPTAGVPAVAVKVTLDLITRQLAEARMTPLIAPPTAAELGELVKNGNPYVVANSLAAAAGPMSLAPAAYVPVVAGLMTSSCYEVRTTAVKLLADSLDAAAMGPLETAVKDRDPYIRAVAALALVQRGRMPPLSIFEEVLTNRDQYGNLPFGATSSVGVAASPELVYRALAPRSDAEVFKVLLTRPPAKQNYDFATSVFPALGTSLKAHPEAAEVLLGATNDRYNTTDRIGFARDVFGAAGKEMLPILHKALKSPDRVVRSNAARACGAVGDRASVPELMAAFDLESGLARASIVWALGQLKTTESLPVLAKLYADTRNDARAHAGAGFRQAQATAAMGAQYEVIGQLSEIGGQWDELKAAGAAQKPLDPALNEELLTPQGILEAVRAIGPAASQEFYRVVAAEKDVEARREAAAQLSETTDPAAIEKNLPVLRMLASDEDSTVSLTAAASLVVFNQEAGRAPLLAALDSGDTWRMQYALRSMERIKGGKLGFARKALTACANNPELREEDRTLAMKLLVIP